MSEHDRAVWPTLRVSSGFFSTLGVTPASGRWFVDDDNKVTTPGLVVLSAAAVRQMQQTPDSAVGATLRLDGSDYTIVGVMAPEFTFPDSSIKAWVLDPLTLRRLEQRRLFDAVAFVRLESAANVVAQQLYGLSMSESDDLHRPIRFALEPLASVIVGESAALTAWLSVAAYFFLALVVANLVTLALAVSATREADVRTKLALGATPLRLRLEAIGDALVIGLPSLATAVAGGGSRAPTDNLGQQFTGV
jgi:hypothetical protein